MLFVVGQDAVGVDGVEGQDMSVELDVAVAPELGKAMVERPSE